MVEIAGKSEILRTLKSKLTKAGCLGGGALIAVTALYSACSARVLPNEYGVEQRRFGMGKTGIVEHVYGPGLYFVGPGTTMHTFPREIHVLEASNDRDESRAKARTADVSAKVDEYFDTRNRVLGQATHRVVEALNDCRRALASKPSKFLTSSEQSAMIQAERLLKELGHE